MVAAISLIVPQVCPKPDDFPVIYNLLADSDVMTSSHDPKGLAKFYHDVIMPIYEDRARFTVATYRRSAAIAGKALLVNQIGADDFYEQVKANFGLD